MKKTIGALLVLLCLMLTATALCAQRYPVMGVSNSPTVNVRKGTSTTSPVLYLLDRNERVTVLAFERNPHGKKWYKIRNEAGEEGYVMTEFITLLEDEPVPNPQPAEDWNANTPEDNGWEPTPTPMPTIDPHAEQWATMPPSEDDHFSPIVTPAPTAVPEESNCAHLSYLWQAEQTVSPMVTGTMTEKKVCTDCGAVLDSRTRVQKMHNGQRFLFTPRQFCERIVYLNKISPLIPGLSAELRADGDDMAAVLSADAGNLSAVITFMDDQTALGNDDRDAAKVTAIAVDISAEKPEGAMSALQEIIMACDSAATAAEASSLAQRLTETGDANQPVVHNGVCYAFGSNGEAYRLAVSLNNE
ncbi:MAG: SH3 domain-containing protein [Clostridia bacterium]|nr:SH3 domain-containing protein [Clostridia bacterium]